MPAQNWQQPPQWRMPQQGFGQFPPRFQSGGQYRPFPAAPAMARENPLSTELKQAQEQLAEAHSTIEQLRIKLQESLAAETRLSDKITYNTREEQALRIRVTELARTLKATNATQEQHQQLTAERDQLLSKLTNLNKQLTALQSKLQAAMQVLIQARSSTGMASEAPGTARIQIEALRDALGRLEAELDRQETGLQSSQQIPTE
jgi:chromosome segregation ATPase